MRDQAQTVTGSQDPQPGYDIEVRSSLASLPPKVLKDDDTFAVLDGDGDCGKGISDVEGVYFRDTRYLSRWQLTMARRPLLRLSSVVDSDNAALTVALTNPDLDGLFAKDAIAVKRTKFVLGNECHERISLHNFDLETRTFTLELSFDADFLDLFEVRGMKRARHGTLSRHLDGASVVFCYAGLDDIRRETRLAFDPPPQTLSTGRATFAVSLAPNAAAKLDVCMRFGETEEIADSPALPFIPALLRKRRTVRSAIADAVRIESSDKAFNRMVARSMSDLSMLISAAGDDRYPHAGIPWFSTVFGRDGLITALLMLWVAPSIARGVLLYLAATQARAHEPSRDAEPGKILHEERRCETARTGEIPFAAYYGTVDATPLFVLLAGRYFEATGDAETIARIWASIEAALAWCESLGDRDGDGFVEYFRETPEGLANQGWKDSGDSIFHADGTLARGSIAVVEVQSYVYAARLAGASLAESLGKPALAEHWRARAASLKTRFNEVFWLEALGTYALALDGEKRPCAVLSSNAGHVLFTGLAPPERARRVASTLLAPDLFSGWGVRTIASSAARYNPMSYHNGSIWPHDNALIGMGFGHMGLRSELIRLFQGLYDAQSHQPDYRLPELFCGFAKRPGRSPIAYPVSCSPQAWAAAAPLGLLGACLGIAIDHERRCVQFANPVLPGFLDWIVLRNLRIDGAAMDVRLERSGEGVACEVLRRNGTIEARVVAEDPIPG